MDSKLLLALIAKKVIEWQVTPQLPAQQELRRKELLLAYLLYRNKIARENLLQERRFWVRPIFTEDRRIAQGASNNLIPEMMNIDHDKYFEYLRMSPETFNELLELIRCKIEKQKVIRTPISAATRLQICLRYLASGDTMPSISFAFRVGLNTVSKIISETCQAISDVLSELVFSEITEDFWLQKAEEFETLWNFPNCIGSIDGRHMEIMAPPNKGSTYFNYKGNHSIVLLAISDANCCFTAADIGAEGRRSDGGIFLESSMGMNFYSNSVNLPPWKPIEEGGPNLPFVLVGDEAFALTSFMMRPYPKAHDLNVNKKIFNYRLSRARRTIECAFGILTSRWRIFKRPITTSEETAQKIVQATVCLHNFLIQKDLRNSEESRQYSTLLPADSTITDRSVRTEADEVNNEQNENNNDATLIREEFLNYFCNTGAMDNQLERLLRNDY